MTSGVSELAHWLDARASSLDQDEEDCATLLPRLAEAGIFAVGLAQEDGGAGGNIVDAVETIAEVSRHSLAAGFVAWGHRTFIEYLAQSSNLALRASCLPSLLAGTLAGATGLSNAMKALSGLEGLQITATPDRDGGYRLNGKLPWVTNLRRERFIVAAAVAETGTDRMMVVAVPSDASGVARSPNLDLMAMCASNTAAIDLVDVPLPAEGVLTDTARVWLPRVRPAFLGLQCGMSIGLARRSLEEARGFCGAGRHILREPVEEVGARLARATAEMMAGLRADTFITAPARLFELRIALAELAHEAVSLELQAAGGRAYLCAPGTGFQRRWREAAFVPIITPSLVQLKAALAAHRQELAA